MTHDKDMPRSSSSPGPSSVIDKLFQPSRVSNQLESVIEFSSSLQAQHAAVQSTISELECKVSYLESLFNQSQTKFELLRRSHVAVQLD